MYPELHVENQLLPVHALFVKLQQLCMIGEIGEFQEDPFSLKPKQLIAEGFDASVVGRFSTLLCELR
jgi:hypothetical protein